MATTFMRFVRISQRTLSSSTPFRSRPQRPSFRPVFRRLRSNMGSNSSLYLNQISAKELDEDLMGELGFSVEQLMELAGLSVASAIHAEYTPLQFPRVLVIAGPGNNGGDGLVAARHLTHFGHQVQNIPQISYPLPSNRILYNNLLKQCRNLEIEHANFKIYEGNALREQYDLIVDAIFGFSFKGDPRPPFDFVLEALRPNRNPPPIISVDIPSGWDVEKGDLKGSGIQPDMLVSLSAPKECARTFKGRYHYLGGRFLPPGLIKKFKLKLPNYSGSSTCVKLDHSASDLASMRTRYVSPILEAKDLHSDPFEQFKTWFEAYSNLNVTPEPNAMILATCGNDRIPSARYVLLKGFENGGFVFYTNYESKKAKQIEENAHAALCFYMEPLKRQIRVEGSVQKLSEEQSTAYFLSRPRESQMGAWTSDQSRPLSNRTELEAKLKEIQQRFSDPSISIPKPPHWGGFVLTPFSIEFWQGQSARLHDRFEYRRAHVDGPWTVQRLSP